jgi:hypothetical protein
VSSPEEEQREAGELARIFEGRTPELVSFLSGQLAVLKSQGQIYLGIAGVCISVTGFAGHNMVNAGPLSAASMIAGIALILVAILLALRALAAIRWVTQDLGGSPDELALRVIRRRNAQQRWLTRTGALIGAGLALYLVAVVIAAWARGHWTPP